MLLDEGVVDAAATAGLPPPGDEHPLLQPVPGVTEMCVGALPLAGAEAVEGDGEVVDADEFEPRIGYTSDDMVVMQRWSPPAWA